VGSLAAIRDKESPRRQSESADHDPLTATRLVVYSGLALESRDDTHVIVFDMVSGGRTKLSLSAYRFLKGFESPHRVDQVVAEQSLPRILPQVRMLIEKRMLVDADAPPSYERVRLRTAPAYKFCNAPAYARATEPDFVILGAPYDLAGDIDSRLAPALIRRKSLDYSYQLEFGEGRPRGWFDVNRGVRMLSGATLADAGDVPVEYGESRARYFERVGEALAQCCTGQSVPVILGGDRSVSCAGLGALRGEGKLTVLQISAEPDRSAAEGAGRGLLQMDRVERVVNLGADMLRESDPEEIVRAWGDELSIYLSIDLSIVPETYVKAAVAALPPGSTLHELKTSIAAIGRVHHIVGIDLVGLDLGSRSPELTAIVGCHLALAAMSAAHDRF
jgi:agmatinase